MEETRHFYDRRGRLTRSVTTREPRFTELDRGELLALAMYRDNLCPLCGRPLDVCTSMEGVGPDFTPTYSTCRATAVVLAKQRALAESKTKNPDAPAFLWTATTER